MRCSLTPPHRRASTAGGWGRGLGRGSWRSGGALRCPAVGWGWLGAGIAGRGLGLGWLLKNVRRLPTSVGQGLLRGGIRSVAGRRECHFKVQNCMY